MIIAGDGTTMVYASTEWKSAVEALFREVKDYPRLSHILRWDDVVEAFVVYSH